MAFSKGEISDGMRRAMVREPALRQSHENNPRPKLPDTKPAQQAGALGEDDEGKAQSAGRPHVRFTLYRVRLLDTDAKWGSVKDLLDSIATCGIIPGDREDQITLDVRQIKVGSYKEEKTVIEIEL